MWIPPAHSPFSVGHALGALSAGERDVEALGGALRERFEAEDSVLTDSGTHALQLALQVAVARADERRRKVALPAYSCFDLVTAALGAAVEPVFYDLDPGHLVPEPTSLRRAVAEGAGVVVAANLFGFPLDAEPLDELRTSEGVVLVEDAAQGLGARSGGRDAGTLGDLTVLSFGRGKGWTGSGGGALLLRGATAAAGVPPAPGPADVSRMGLAGRALAQWALARPTLYGAPARVPMLHLGETRFHAPSPPRAMHPYQAGLALRSAAAARREIPGRQVSARALGAALEDVPGCQLPHPLGSGEASWLRLPFLMDGLPDELPLELRRLGVQRAYPRLLPVLYARHDRSQRGDPSFPGSERLVREILTAPTHSRVPPGRLAGALRTTLSALARQSSR